MGGDGGDRSVLLVEMEVMALEPPLSPTFFFFYLYLLK
jgi:hypothetical protein